MSPYMTFHTSLCYFPPFLLPLYCTQPLPLLRLHLCLLPFTVSVPLILLLTWTLNFPSSLAILVMYTNACVKTLNPTLLVEVWMSQAQSNEQRKAVPIIHLSWSGMGGEELPSSFPPVIAWADRWESWPCGQKSMRAGPDHHHQQHSEEQAVPLTKKAQ